MKLKILIIIFLGLFQTTLHAQTQTQTYMCNNNLGPIKVESKSNFTQKGIYIEILNEFNPVVHQIFEMYGIKNESDYMAIKVINNDKKHSYLVDYCGIPMIREAQDENGNWLPIEYINEISNYFHVYDFKKKHYLPIVFEKTEGDFKTMLRVKLILGQEIIYSEPYEGSINYTQFISVEKKE